MYPFSARRFLQVAVLQLVLIACFHNNHAYSQFQVLDKSTLRELTEDRREEPTEFYQFLSRSTNYISLSVPVSLLAAGIIGHDAEMKQKAFYIGETILVSTAITTALKYSIRRPRPAPRFPDKTASQ